MPSDIESSDWNEQAALNIQPAPAGWPANSSPMIVYSNGREDMGAIKRDWNRRNPTVTSGGAANVQTLTYTQGPVAYVMGQTYAFIAGFSNSGAVTLNVNGLGAKAIQLNGAALAAGAIIAGSITQCVYDGTQFQLTLAGSGAYLPLAGGTLTGALICTGTSPLQVLGTGATPFVGGASGNASFILNKITGVGFVNAISGFTSNSQRWQMLLGNNLGESGSNVGSDFSITRFSDAGAAIDAPLTITRSSGTVSVASLTATTGISMVSGNINGAAGTNRQFLGYTNGVPRWQMVFGNATAEGGSNAGSDFAFNAFSDAGTNLGSVFSIVRATRVVTFAVAIVNSDRRLKTDIAPIEDALTTIAALQGVTYHRRAEPEQRHIGLIAQDVREVLPEVVHESAEKSEDGDMLLGVDYAKIVAVLIEAVKDLTAKVARLEARLEAVSQA